MPQRGRIPSWFVPVAAAVLAAGALASGGCGPDSEPAVDAATPPYDPWTLVVLPDTQQLTYLYPDIWYAQTGWIAEHAAADRILMVLHVGDVTEWNTTPEWQVARTGLDQLDGVVPIALVPGNHDYDVSRERVSGLTAAWPVADLAAAPSFGGLFEADRTDNHYQLLDIDGDPWLFLALEWGPRPEVLAWARGVLDGHPGHHVVIVTHAFLYSDGRRYDWAALGGAQAYNPHAYVGTAWPEVNDGEEIWSALIADRSTVDLVVSGHVPDVVGARLTSPATGGHPVHQVLANFQGGPMGGEGYLRIMTFHGDRIEVRTYSPWLDAELTDADHRFELPWSPAATR